MKRIVLCGVFVAALLASLGCGGGSDSVTSTPPSATGTWAATLTATGGTQLPNGAQFTATLVLVQIAPDLWEGTYSTQGGSTGTIFGQLTGYTFTFSTFEGGPCGGVFDGVGTLNGSSTGMSGTYAGSDCTGTLQATFVAARQ